MQRPAGMHLNGRAGILVVDDELPLARVISRVLERAGFRTFVASNGLEGLNCYQEHRGEISAVVSDVVMPEMDGVEMMSAIWNLDAGVAVLFISGYPNREFTSLNAPYRFLSKPFRQADILSEVRMLLPAPAM